MALGKKILGVLLVVDAINFLFIREPRNQTADIVTGVVLFVGGVALFLWGMRRKTG